MALDPDYIRWFVVPGAAVQIFQENSEELLEKGAESPLLRELATLWQVRPGNMAGTGVPNAPGPLMATLVGGMAGAGLGYGTGKLLEHFLPPNWKRNRLARTTRTTTMLGAGLGALPGAGYAALNYMAGYPLNHAGITAGYEFPARPAGQSLPHVLDFDLTDFGKAGEDFRKMAYETGAGYLPAIDVNEFNQVVWQDPRVARPLPPAIQAAATGVVSGAANLPGRHDSRYVTPMDIGRMAAGMGTGYLSGALVGQALGTMMGMPDETQEKLKNTGMWAGLLMNLVPKIFGD